jgi:formylglycine-generating enzyme required for sulfatase activity
MTSSVQPSLARIPAGDFLMGASDAGRDQRPVHRVWVSEFFIGRFPVTQDEYARFVRATGRPAPAVRTLPLIAAGEREEEFRALAASYAWRDDAWPEGRGSHPVVLVGHEDAQAYCAWLSHQIGRDVRLPTEAEWEKAARGGREGQRYPWGDELDPSRCNYLPDPSAKNERGTRPAGTYEPNGYGLYDMVGNVWEWVADWYGSEYYAAGDTRDPRGPLTGTMRVVRGGSWVNSDEAMLRIAYRHQVPPDTYAHSIGFRIVCTG